MRYLDAQRDALRWKLEGLGERELRMPMTPTGTNLLGLAKHVATVAAEYFGTRVGATGRTRRCTGSSCT